MEMANNQVPGPSKKPRKSTGRRRKDLSMLHTMPLDVLFEILSRLSLKDLLSVSRANREFCKLLWSRSATSIWKVLREEIGAPEPHPDISEPRWALLMFDGLRCQSCNAPNVKAVDFGIRRRVCRECKRKNLVPTGRVAKRYPQYDPVITDFLPETGYLGSWLHSGARGSYHWKSDIEEYGTAWNELQENVKLGIPGAQAKLDDFRKRKTRIRAIIDESIEPYIEWAHDQFKDQAKSVRDAAVSRKEEIIKRLRELGYEEIDIAYIKYENEVIQGRNLTERIWNTIRPKLEAKLIEHRRTRLITACKPLIEPYYDAYMRGIRPREWHLQPSLEQLLWQPDLDPLVFAPSGTTGTSPLVTQVASQLPLIASSWLEEQKTALRLLVDASHVDANERQASTSRNTSPSSSDVDSIDVLTLATTVWQCRCRYAWEDKIILDWQAALSHLSCTGWDGKQLLNLSVTAKTTATNLVTLLGLDPGSTTKEQMDNTTAIFFSGMLSSGPLHGETVHTWRTAVCKASENSEYGISQQAWLSLNGYHPGCVLQTQSVYAIGSTWACTRCPAHYPMNKNWYTIKKHLIELHQIAHPNIPEDVIFHPAKPPELHLQYWAQEALPDDWVRHARFACKHCSFAANELRDVREHLHHQHGDQASAKDYIDQKPYFGYFLSNVSE